jgi:inosose dehydratase
MLSADHRRSEATTMVGTQLYGWGQDYRARGQDLRDHLDPVLAAVRACGYETAEGFLRADDPEEAPRFAARLRAHALQPLSLYAGGAFHEPLPADETIEALLAAARPAVAAGYTVLNVNPDPIGRDKTDAELAVQAAALERLGQGLRALGMRLGLHNHDPEMRHGAREFHANLRQTTPENVGLCLDTHWCYRGGADPYALLQAYADRVVSFHLRQSIDGTWTEELCDGDIDYRPIASWCRDRRFTGPLLVELATERGTPQTRDIVENHRRSRGYVQRIFGV